MTILVTTYGAVGNGTTDDTAAINAAIAAAKDGDIVEFPGTAASYRITGPIAVNKRVKLSSGGAKLKLTTATATLNVTAPFAFIEGLYIEGSRTTGQIGIRLGAEQITVTDCEIFLTDVGMEVWGGVWHRIEKVRMRNIATTVMKISNVVGTVVDDVRYDTDSSYPQPVDGILLNGEGCAFSNLDIIHAGNALHIAGAAIHSPMWNFFTSCSFDTSVIGALIESSVAGASVRGVMFSQCWFSSHSSAAIQIQGSQTLDGLTFNSCHIINNQNVAVAISGTANNVALESCVFSGNAVTSHNYPNIYTNTTGKKIIRACQFSSWGGLQPQVTLDVLRDTNDGPCVLTDNYGEKGVFSATGVAAQVGFNFGTGWPTR